jgi:hypothetical protein
MEYLWKKSIKKAMNHKPGSVRVKPFWLYALEFCCAKLHRIYPIEGHTMLPSVLKGSFKPFLAVYPCFWLPGKQPEV